MVKKVREYKSGDFIFAKVKGYPAWPARVQRMNGKKYFVYFYGTGEIANLPPNMIFDYAENKEKFLTKTVKRRDFNDGVKQIEHDFANNVPLEQVVGINLENTLPANETANDSAINETMDDTAVDDTIAEEPSTIQNNTAVEDSDETGALVIDEGKPKGRKSKVEGKAKETPIKPGKEPKTPRGKAKKEEQKKDDEDEEKKDDEIVSRSGRKIRPKRYMDEQTEDNATLPSPAPKKRRAASPVSDKDKDIQKEMEKPEAKEREKNIKHVNAISQSELEDLKEPFKSDDSDKENILIAYLPNGQYVGVKLFQSRPTSFKNEAARLQWDKQAAANAITLKLQLEKGQITTQSVIGQLVMDLNLTDEEKATLDKERETEERKSRVQFLKTEMKLIELDAKIKTCLSLEKADTDLCLKLLDELMELDVKPLMLLKHPTCLETVKRMRAYVGNTPSWDLSESASIVFSKQAHKIRKQADTMYKNMKELFTTPEGLSFWEYFSERVLQFKKVTSKLSADELLELIHDPLDMTVPTSHTMTAAIEAANEEEEEADKKEDETPEPEEQQQKKKTTLVKAKKAANNNTKTPLKRQSSRKQQDDKEKNEEAEESNDEPDNNVKENAKENAKIEKKKLANELNKELGEAAENMEVDEQTEQDNDKESDTSAKDLENSTKEDDKTSKNNEKNSKNIEKSSKDTEKNVKDTEKSSKDKEKSVKNDKTPKEKSSKDNNKSSKNTEKNSKETEKNSKDAEKNSKDTEKSVKDEDKSTKDDDKSSKESETSANESEVAKAEDKLEEKEKEIGEPRAKRTRESKKSEPPPPRSPAKRKAKS